MSNSLANQLIVIALVTQIRQGFVTADIPNCAFQDTVSLVNIRPDSDGSYNYQGLRIPHNLTAVYRYEELSDGTRVSVPPHIRGCACKLKQCIQLCCLNNEMLDSTSKKCVNMNAVTYPRITTYMDNFTENGMIDVFQDFVPQQRMPCEEFKILNTELDSDYNILFENGTLYHVMEDKYIRHRDFCLTPFWYNKSLSLNPVKCVKKSN